MSAYPTFLFQNGTAASVMSFGRFLAHESHRRTNPRSGWARYGDLGVWLMPEQLVKRQKHSLRLGADARLTGSLATSGITSRPVKAVQNSFCSIERKRYRQPQQGCDLQVERAVPGHDAVHLLDRRGAGGARGWLQRSMVSMMIMRPPQQEQGGRWSDGSGVASGAAGAVGGAPRSSRARARLSRRPPLASRP